MTEPQLDLRAVEARLKELKEILQFIGAFRASPVKAVALANHALDDLLDEDALLAHCRALRAALQGLHQHMYVRMLSMQPMIGGIATHGIRCACGWESHGHPNEGFAGSVWVDHVTAAVLVTVKDE